MSSKQIVEVQEQLYKEIYEKFSQLVAELTALVEDSQKKVDKYKSNLETNTIPNALIDEFVEQRRRLLVELVNKAEKANSFFPIIDYVEKALDEIEESLSRFEEQCSAVNSACLDRRPKKGFSLFNKKEQSGTDVPPPMWVHPDYLFNPDAMITKLKQVRDVSEAAMKTHLDEQFHVCKKTQPTFIITCLNLVQTKTATATANRPQQSPGASASPAPSVTS